MIGKIANWVIIGSLLVGFGYIVKLSAESDNRKIQACKAKGMIYVQPFRERGYCAEGFRP